MSSIFDIEQSTELGIKYLLVNGWNSKYTKIGGLYYTKSIVLTKDDEYGISCTIGRVVLTHYMEGLAPHLTVVNFEKYNSIFGGSTRDKINKLFPADLHKLSFSDTIKTEQELDIFIEMVEETLFNKYNIVFKHEFTR